MTFFIITENKYLTNTLKGYILWTDTHDGYLKGEILWQKNCCCKTSKKREAKEYKDLINRLSRIEGQVRGVKGMVEKDAYCIDILTQVSAINAALNSFSKELLGNHIRTCVTDDIKQGNTEVTEELIKTLHKLMK